jgi:putative membrane protein insertion efficiency factor
MKYVLIGFIKIYQYIPGPWHNSCRHIPTCSNYAIEAIKKHGSLKGINLSIRRLAKCTPWGTIGIDNVPNKEEI